MTSSRLTRRLSPRLRPPLSAEAQVLQLLLDSHRPRYWCCEGIECTRRLALTAVLSVRGRHGLLGASAAGHDGVPRVHLSVRALLAVQGEAELGAEISEADTDLLRLLLGADHQ